MIAAVKIRLGNKITETHVIARLDGEDILEIAMECAGLTEQPVVPLAASIAAGIEAPIRFYVTENADRTATLSYKTPTAVFAPYADGGEKLTAMARELNAIFAKIAKEATAP